MFVLENKMTVCTWTQADGKCSVKQRYSAAVVSLGCNGGTLHLMLCMWVTAMEVVPPGRPLGSWLTYLFPPVSGTLMWSLYFVLKVFCLFV